MLLPGLKGGVVAGGRLLAFELLIVRLLLVVTFAALRLFTFGGRLAFALLLRLLELFAFRLLLLLALFEFLFLFLLRLF